MNYLSLTLEASVVSKLLIGLKKEDFPILDKCEMIKFWLTWGKADHTLELRNQGNLMRALEGT